MQVATPWVDVRMAPLTRPRERRREGPQNDELARSGGAMRGGRDPLRRRHLSPGTAGPAHRLLTIAVLEARYPPDASVLVQAALVLESLSDLTVVAINTIDPPS